MSTKSMPYSIEAEESLLGNIMLYPDSIRESVDASITLTIGIINIAVVYR